MRTSVARESGEQLDAALEELLLAEPDLPYARFSPIAGRDGAAVQMHRRRWQRGAADLGALVARDGHDRPLATAYLTHREFESEHFGFPMARISPPAATVEEEPRLRGLLALYRAAADLLREHGCAHLSADVSAGDRVAGHALQEIGADYVGTKIHWMAPLTGKRAVDVLPSPLRIESCPDRHRISEVPARAWSRLTEWGERGFHYGPLVFDMKLPNAAARGVYRVWTEKVMSGEWAQALYLVWDGNEIVAFNCVMRLDDLSEAAGVPIVGRGLGATLPGYRGLFTALQKTMTAERPLGARFLENETRAGNVPTINVFGRLGHQCVRSTATFHLHLNRSSSTGLEQTPAPLAER